MTVVSGYPAESAVGYSSDGMSVTTTAYITGGTPGTDPIWAKFYFTRVATGTWQVFISSANFYAIDIGSVTVTNGATTYIPNPVTIDPWRAPGFNNAVLDTIPDYGYIRGQVRDTIGANGNPITPNIQVTADGNNLYPADYNSNPPGQYLIPVSPGSCYTVTANPGNLDFRYVWATVPNVCVGPGQIVTNLDYPDLNFKLPWGGRIGGFVTGDGYNGLPDISVSAQNNTALAVVRQEVTDAAGNFEFLNLTTGTYIIKPALDNKERFSFSSASADAQTYNNVILNQATDLFIGTFSITGAMGKLTGKCTLYGQPIPSGVLVVATTAPIAQLDNFGNPRPPLLSSAAIPGTVYYADASQEDGTFSMEVRGSTSATPTYCLYAWYFTLFGSTTTLPTNASSTPCGLQVPPGTIVDVTQAPWCTSPPCKPCQWP